MIGHYLILFFHKIFFILQMYKIKNTRFKLESRISIYTKYFIVPIMTVKHFEYMIKTFPGHEYFMPRKFIEYRSMKYYIWQLLYFANHEHLLDTSLHVKHIWYMVRIPHSFLFDWVLFYVEWSIFTVHVMPFPYYYGAFSLSDWFSPVFLSGHFIQRKMTFSRFR